LNPGPPAPEAGIIPLDQTARCVAGTLAWRTSCSGIIQVFHACDPGSTPCVRIVLRELCLCHSSIVLICRALVRNSPHWGLNPGPSVYKTDALPLSYRGVAFHCRAACCAFRASMPVSPERRNRTPACLHAPGVEVPSGHQPDSPRLQSSHSHAAAHGISCIARYLLCAKPTARGFEPLRAEPNGFLVHHLNHSVTLSCRRCGALACLVSTARRGTPHWLDICFRRSARGCQEASCGIRTHDLPLTERVLCQLS
jgi:hypothetical protein